MMINFKHFLQCNHAYICEKLVGANEQGKSKWAETLAIVRQEEAEKGYDEESSEELEEDEESKAEREDRYNQPLDIDLDLIKKKAAQLLGVPVEELPIAKANAAAEALMKKNPPAEVVQKEKDERVELFPGDKEAASSEVPDMSDLQ